MLDQPRGAFLQRAAQFSGARPGLALRLYQPGDLGLGGSAIRFRGVNGLLEIGGGRLLCLRHNLLKCTGLPAELVPQRVLGLVSLLRRYSGGLPVIAFGDACIRPAARFSGGDRVIQLLQTADEPSARHNSGHVAV